MIFANLVLNWNYIDYFESIWTDEDFSKFSSEMTPEVEYNMQIAHSISYIVSL